ncbi:MAG: transglutaminase domain-containing protein, partial [Phaeodactylibacter sp.]|nr:transglutaminase domain-containing protein [Phaeodactylibacter sp.]
LSADAGSDAEKITALYRYLQENMRYVSVQLGIGGWRPSSAAYVAENKYGDCKALSNFMKALLREAGITAYPALIAHGRVPYEVKDSFTYPLFNHAILYIPSEDMWLECTSSTFPAGYIGAGNDGRHTLLITPEGGRLKATPALTGEDNRVVGKTTVTLAEDGAATVVGKLRFAGSRHESFRQRRAYSSRKELEDWFVGQSNLPAPVLESLDIQTAPDAPEAVCRYRAASARFASKAGRRL